MKKRILSTLLSTTMVFTLLAACNTNDTPSTTAAPATDPVVTTAAPTDAPETDAPETDAPSTDATEAPGTTDEEPGETEAPGETEEPGTTDDTQPGETEPETIGDVELEPAGDPPTGPVTYDTVQQYDDVKEYSFLMAWNGGAGQFPIGFNDGAVTKAIEERTGVRLIAETIVSSEREKLSQVFMSGIIPDITNAPHWSTNPGGEGELIMEAGINGLLLDLAPYLETYPNINQAINQGVSDVYKERDIFNPKYNGAVYVMPTQTGRTGADIQNWAYNIWVRQDILQDLGYEQSDINNPDTFYEMLVKIKDGGYTDINGLPVIPSGAWHDGWAYSDFLTAFGDLSVTGWHVNEDGTVVNDIFLPYWDERIKFMRKLTAEGLFDREAFTQTDTVAQEKAITGRVAVLNAHYPNIRDFMGASLYLTNPEMQYVPVGPMQNDQGDSPKFYTRPGRTGSPVVFLNAEIEEPDRALNFLDFLNSDEGLLLSFYGIEGTHYTWEDGIPTITEEWEEIKATDGNKWHLEGFGIGENTVGARPMKSWGWDADYASEGYTEARSYVPNVYFEGTTMDDITNAWEGREAYQEALATIDWGDEQERAYLSGSEEEALAILENYRQRLRDAGIDEMTELVQEAYDNDPEIIW